MVRYITRDEIKRFTTGRTNFSESAVLRKAADRAPSGATFLSHSSKDVDLLPGVILLLEEHGAKVYIDKKDDALPPYTSRETAKILRGRIDQSRKFILLVTKNSKDSRWMPWELGIADGYKRSPNVAILPSPELASENSWAEQEYLGVYDRVARGRLEGFSSEVFMVYNQEKHSATELSRWLSA